MDGAICGLPAAAGPAPRSAHAGELGGGVRRPRKPLGVRALVRSGSPAFLGCAAWAPGKSAAVPADPKSANAGELGGGVRRPRKPLGVRALFRSGSPAFLGCAAWAPGKSAAVPADSKSANAGELGGRRPRKRRSCPGSIRFARVPRVRRVGPGERRPYQRTRNQLTRANLVAGVSTTSARGAARSDAIRRSSAASS